jgi:hypothetical protein
MDYLIYCVSHYNRIKRSAKGRASSSLAAKPSVYCQVNQAQDSTMMQLIDHILQIAESSPAIIRDQPILAWKCLDLADDFVTLAAMSSLALA